MKAPVWEQGHFRFYADDGSWSAATPHADQDNTATIPLDTTFRLIISWGDTNGQLDGVSIAPYLQFRLNNGGGFGSWTTCSGATAIALTTSAYHSDGATTTSSRLTGPTGADAGYVITEFDTSGATALRAFADQWGELEFALTMDSGSVNAGAAIEFRLVYSGDTLFANYQTTPTLNVLQLVQASGTLTAGAAQIAGNAVPIVAADGALAAGAAAISGRAGRLITAQSIGNGKLQLSLPAANNHDFWKTSGVGTADQGGVYVYVPHVLQDIGTLGDFQITAKWDTPPTPSSGNQMGGIIIADNTGAPPGAYIRFDVYSNGSGFTYFAAYVNDSTNASESIDSGSTTKSPVYLRVTYGYAADSWLFEWSEDGATWDDTNSGTPYSLAASFTPARAGLWSGNYNGTEANAPAFTSQFDWFHVTGGSTSLEDDEFNAGALNPRWTAYTQADTSVSVVGGAGGLEAGAASISGDASTEVIHQASGALTAGAASISGYLAHHHHHTAGGALTAGTATISGVAVRSQQHTAAGTLTAAAPTIAGDATRTLYAAGTLTAAAPTIAGDANLVVAATGALTAGAPTISGTATRGANAAGTLTAAAPSISGAAIRTLYAAGTLTAAAPTISGVATRTAVHTAAGSLTADAPTITGRAGRPLTADGSLTANAPSISGAAQVQLLAFGSLTADAPTISGDATRSANAAGTLTASAPTISGVAVRTLNAAAQGVLTADAPTISGAAVRTLYAAGTLTAGAPTISGDTSLQGQQTARGVLTAGAPSISGAATMDFATAGALTAAAPTISGAVRMGYQAAGALTAAAPVVSGTASLVGQQTAAGALVAAAPVISGLAIRTAYAAGSLTAGAPQVSGTAVRKVVTTGALAAAAPIIAGSSAVTIGARGALVAGAPQISGLAELDSQAHFASGLLAAGLAGVSGAAVTASATAASRHSIRVAAEARQVSAVSKTRTIRPAAGDRTLLVSSD